MVLNKDHLQEILSPEKYRRYGGDLERILEGSAL